jgi:hypothetical protein
MMDALSTKIDERISELAASVGAKRFSLPKGGLLGLARMKAPENDPEVLAMWRMRLPPNDNGERKDRRDD